jgi:hypothetical protein
MKPKKKEIERICDECVTEPENFSSMLLPLSECYKKKWHVHKADHGGYVVVQDQKVWIETVEKRIKPLF